MNSAADPEAAIFAAPQDGDLAKPYDALAAGASVNAANPGNVTPLLKSTGDAAAGGPTAASSHRPPEFITPIWPVRISIA